MTQQTTARTFSLTGIELRDLAAADLRREAVLANTPDETRAYWEERLSSEDIESELESTSTEEPFAQHPALAYRVDIDGSSMHAEALVVTTTSRIGIAWGGDASWGDLRDDCDLTTVEGGDRFRDAVWDAVNDWLNDAEAWAARA